MVYRAARGTPAAPTAVQTDDILGGLAVRGYGATTFSAGRGQVMFKAAENWTDSANGTYLQFTTTPLGAADWAERMRITPDGYVGIGTTSPAQMLSVAGTIESTTGGFKFPDGTIQTTATGAVGQGYWNTATGVSALSAGPVGFANTADGAFALSRNTSGYNNTAVGAYSLNAIDVGHNNTAAGAFALRDNLGVSNTAVGAPAMLLNTTGSNNTAIGVNSLASNTTGSYNIAVGRSAGYNLTTGSDNIDIGHAGVAAESNTIRLGDSLLQTQTFIAGIRGVTTGHADGVAVVIDNQGQLGTVSSSRRVKDDIADMAAASSGLMSLRPVTFHYKSDQNPAGRTLQYGLIAEEVAEHYPGLVAHSADGQIETVMYQFLPPMLLNEVQKQQRTIESQQRTIDALRGQVASQDAQTRKLAEQVEALTRAVAALSDRKQ